MSFYHDRLLPRLISRVMRASNLAEYRARTVSEAEGRVLEIGIGSGLNLPFYCHRVDHVLGLDPSDWLLRHARDRADALAVPVTLLRGSAERIPLDRASVETVVTTWSLCSVADLGVGLSEIRRVLKPGGRLLFVEHGLADEARVRRWQRRLTPLWRRISGGCHLDRPIAARIEGAGFRIEPLSVGYMPGARIAGFMYEGIARPR